MPSISETLGRRLGIGAPILLPMSYIFCMSAVLVHIESGVQRVTLNRPERLNAFNLEMHSGLAAALDQAERDASIRALLVTGNGRGFCAGADLAERDMKPGAAIDPGEGPEKRYKPPVTSKGAAP